MNKSVIVITTVMAALMAMTATIQLALAYTTELVPNEYVEVQLGNGTSVSHPLVLYQFEIGPDRLQYNVTMPWSGITAVTHQGDVE